VDIDVCMGVGVNVTNAKLIMRNQSRKKNFCPAIQKNGIS